MKSFGIWTVQELREVFQLDDVKTLPELGEWLSANIAIEAHLLAELNSLQEGLIALNEAWNEYELKMHFIAPLMRLVGYGTKGKYNAFYQRTISAKIENIEIGGIVDMLVAKGWESPTKPYCFLHEYKQEERKGDARAELLSAMLVAQAQNANEKPIYGVYLIGASKANSL